MRISRRIVAFTLVPLMGSGAALVATAGPANAASTVVVHAGQSIQKAIDMVGAGGTVVVQTGTATVLANNTYDNLFGIFVRNAEHGVIQGNDIHDNCVQIPGGSPPTGNTVTGNIIHRNKPVDIFYGGTGSGNTFGANLCMASVPPGLCRTQDHGVRV